jgi:hypothetical protein
MAAGVLDGAVAAMGSLAQVEAEVLERFYEAGPLPRAAQGECAGAA